MNNVRNERNTIIDIISGLFILEIVLQHLLQNSGLYENSFYEKVIVRYFFAFMPWFYFKAGLMCHKPNQTRTAIKDRICKLMWPFFVWSSIAIIIVAPLYILNNDIHSFLRTIVLDLFYGSGPFNTPLWFLPSLLIVYITFYFGLLNERWYSIIVWGILSWVFSEIPIRLPLGLNNFPLGCFFFVVGLRMKSFCRPVHTRFVCIYLLLYILIQTFFFSPVNFRLNKLIDNYYIVYLISMIMFLVLIFQLFPIRLRNIPLEYIGKNSIMFYVSHAPVIVFLSYWKLHFYPSCSELTLFCLMLVCVCVMYTLLLRFKKQSKYLFFVPPQFNKNHNGI